MSSVPTAESPSQSSLSASRGAEEVTALASATGGGDCCGGGFVSAMVDRNLIGTWVAVLIYLSYLIGTIGDRSLIR